MKKLFSIIVIILLLVGCQLSDGEKEGVAETTKPTAEPTAKAGLGELERYYGEYIFAGIAALSPLSSSTVDFQIAKKADHSYVLDENGLRMMVMSARITDEFVAEPYDPLNLVLMGYDHLEKYEVDTQYTNYNKNERLFTSPLYPNAIWHTSYSDNTADGSNVVSGSIDLLVRADKTVETEAAEGNVVKLKFEGIEHEIYTEWDNYVSCIDYEGERYELCSAFGGNGIVDAIEWDGRLYYTHSWGSGFHHCGVSYFDYQSRTVKQIYSGMNQDMMLINTPDGIKVFDSSIMQSDDTDDSYRLQATRLLGGLEREGVNVGSVNMIEWGKYSLVMSTWGMGLSISAWAQDEYEGYSAYWQVSAGRLCKWDEENEKEIPLLEREPLDAEIIWIPEGAESATISLSVWSDPISVSLPSGISDSVTFTLVGTEYVPAIRTD